jgi:micrococcal nuclease
MRTRAAIAVLAAVALTGCSAGAKDEGAGRAAAQVDHVVDGDTIVVRLGGREERVRMVGIDAPEASDTRFGAPECGGRAAADFLRARLRAGDGVALVADASQGDRDRYDRLLRYVERDGDDLGGAALAAGRVAVYRTRDPFARQDAYRMAADAARDARDGVWRACGGDFHSAAG